MVWTIFIALLGAALLAILVSLAGSRRNRPDDNTDIVFYRSQLAAIDEARERGETSDSEANAARGEILRRLQAAQSEREQSESTGGAGHALQRRRAAIVLVLVAVPAIAFGLYATGGSPNLPGRFTQLARPTTADQENVDRLLERLEQQLTLRPASPEGWDLLARLQAERGRSAAASEALRQAIRHGGETAGRLLALGQTLLVTAGGVVNEEARRAFESAARLDPEDPRIDFFLSLSEDQDGQSDKAMDRLASALLRSPEDAPWLPLMQAELARLLLSSCTEGKTVPETASERENALHAALSRPPCAGAPASSVWRYRLLADMVVSGKARFEETLARMRENLAEDSGALAKMDDFVRRLTQKGSGR